MGFFIWKVGGKVKNIHKLFRTFTIAIVPTDVNKEVSKVRVPNIIIPISLIFIIISFVFIIYYVDYSNKLRKAKIEQFEINKELESELNVQTEKTISLQNQVKILEEKRFEVQNKLAELNLLETELREHLEDLPIEISGSGGVDIPLTDGKSSQFVKNESDIEFQSEALVRRYEGTLANIIETNKEMEYVPTIWPADDDFITSQFGSRSDPFNRKSAMHTGVDIRGSWGDPVYASAGGKVILAKYNGGYGNSIKIKHNHQFETLYGHLMTILVEENEVVKKGDIIGSIGSTGRSTGPHLHFEIIDNGEYINPKDFLEIFIK